MKLSNHAAINVALTVVYITITVIDVRAYLAMKHRVAALEEAVCAIRHEACKP
jgi:hypothetical protein